MSGTGDGGSPCQVSKVKRWGDKKLLIQLPKEVCESYSVSIWLLRKLNAASSCVLWQGCQRELFPWGSCKDKKGGQRGENRRTGGGGQTLLAVLCPGAKGRTQAGHNTCQHSPARFSEQEHPTRALQRPSQN